MIIPRNLSCLRAACAVSWPGQAASPVLETQSNPNTDLDFKMGHDRVFIFKTAIHHAFYFFADPLLPDYKVFLEHSPPSGTSVSGIFNLQ